MDSFELNKIAGAVLATGMVLLGVNILAGELFTAAAPEQPGYAIAIADDTEAPEAVEEDVTPLGTLLASADPAAGESAVRPCAACHTFEQGGGDRVGPNLYNLVGGPKAHIDGFNYSSAMLEAAAAGEVWGYEELDAFLANPRSYMPGTTMAFAGVRSPETRADIIIYMRELTEDPPALPEVEEIAAAEETAEIVAAEDVDAAEIVPDDDAGEDASGLHAMIAAADPADGQNAARPCVACHTFQEGEANRVGPNLYNIVGAQKAHLDDFRYSAVMQEAGDAGEVWGYEELDAFLANPRGYMPGTTMAFAGVRDEERRAALIAYLRELTVEPPPLQGAQ
jgi:cytochrome c